MFIRRTTETLNDLFTTPSMLAKHNNRKIQGKKSAYKINTLRYFPEGLIFDRPLHYSIVSSDGFRGDTKI